MPKISIIIVNHRSPALLKLCLKSIFQNPPESTFETIVVDSESSRKSRDIVGELFPSVRLFPVDYNTGYAKGVNLGISNSSGEYTLILNPDIVVTENAIQKLVDFAENRSDIGLVAPKLLNHDGSFQQSYFRFYTLKAIAARRTFLGKFGPFKKILSDFLMEDVDNDKLQTPDWISGAAILIKRSYLDRVGLMDERFFMYFEDVDWAKRFWQNGYKVVYYPQALMYHSYHRESKSSWALLDLLFNHKTRWHIKSAIRYFLKYRKSVIRNV